jgi:hypothetical protein
MKQLKIQKNPDGTVEAQFEGDRLYRWQNVIQAMPVLYEFRLKGWTFTYDR